MTKGNIFQSCTKSAHLVLPTYIIKQNKCQYFISASPFILRPCGALMKLNNQAPYRVTYHKDDDSFVTQKDGKGFFVLEAWSNSRIGQSLAISKNRGCVMINYLSVLAKIQDGEDRNGYCPSSYIYLWYYSICPIH